MLNLTTWPISLQVIFLLSDKNQFINQFLTLLMIFLHGTIQSKWKQGTFLVILHDVLHIYRYICPIIHYTFIGWVWGGPAAHLYQLNARDTTPPPQPPTPGLWIMTFPLLVYLQLLGCAWHGQWLWLAAECICGKSLMIFKGAVLSGSILFTILPASFGCINLW